MNSKIWMKRPAKMWEEALPVGNGKIGGMVFGGYEQERIALNIDTLWSGYGKEKLRLGSYEVLESAREKIKKGEYAQADELLYEEFLNDWNESYLPLGDLHIKYLESGDLNSYTRTLHLDSGITTTDVEDKNGRLCTQVYCSVEKQMLIVKIKGENKRGMELYLSSPLRHEKRTQGGSLLLFGTAPSSVQPSYYECDEPIVYDEKHPGMGFCVGLRIYSDGEISHSKDGKIMVKNASETVCYISADTGYDIERGRIGKALNQVKQTCIDNLSKTADWEESHIRENHIKDFGNFYNRMALQLTKEEISLPTDKRLENFEKDQSDLGIVELFFNLGRYLLISCSREGTMAANLQGIWNDRVRAPWSSNYTTNINLQMNYWMAEKANLSELHMPLFELLRRCMANGEKTAKEQFGCRGWTANHNIDAWYQTSPVGRTSKRPPVKYGYYPTAAGWLCLHIWEHYQYTQDLEFLKKYYPVLRGACLFLLDYIQKDDEGYVTIPSTSPENLFYDDFGNECATSIGTAMDLAIVRMLFGAGIGVMECLGIDEEFMGQLQEIKGQTPGYQISSEGELMEWSQEFREVYPDHRHVSHLIGLYPGDDMPDTEELRNACRKTLEKRTMEGPGWSKIWKSCLWARLGDGEKAYEQLCSVIKLIEETEVDYEQGGCYRNLLCAHPPFQIDGNLGAPAAILEMLIQSKEGEIKLLPALPKAWGFGSIRGIVVKGGHTLSFTWEKGRIMTITIDGGKDEEILVKANGSQYVQELKQDKKTNIVLNNS